jgi:hypothetical protein
MSFVAGSLGGSAAAVPEQREPDAYCHLCSGHHAHSSLDMSLQCLDVCFSSFVGVVAVTRVWPSLNPNTYRDSTWKLTQRHIIHNFSFHATLPLYHQVVV